MTPTHSQRERVLAEAVVSSYINELATASRERPSRPAQPGRDRALERVMRLRRSRERSRRELVAA